MPLLGRFGTSSAQASTTFLTCSDAKEALRLHDEVESLTTQLAEAEDRWRQLRAEIEEEWSFFS